MIVRVDAASVIDLKSPGRRRRERFRGRAGAAALEAHADAILTILVAGPVAKHAAAIEGSIGAGGLQV